jgi:hypothetical protein
MIAIRDTSRQPWLPGFVADSEMHLVAVRIRTDRDEALTEKLRQSVA